ncbi:hypothetical protein [Actinorugispora endophytica]|uniref:TPM domain-containing protein n=1 Tax=Actinorugispora endophytica TaxID=1605990 RepID=A0A4R6UP66_9ACTN|nr:hypothetical protein [Actinorugispora endophytica]TDQ45034.1 hypothetical protein EV190_13326 [Actinorugispora endophytica]
MSTDRILAVLLAALLWPLLAAPAAHADPAPSPASTSPASAVAAELRQRPVYVDPSLRSLLSETEQAALEERIASTGQPVYVVVVPLVQGDTWNGEPEQLVGAVRDRMDGDGSYLALGGRGLRLYGESRDPGSAAHYAALAVSSDPDLDDAPLSRQLERAVELIGDGTAEAEYQRIDSEREPYPYGYPWTRGVPLPWAGAGLAVAAALAVLAFTGLRARRLGAPPPPPAHGVFDSIDAAGLDALRERLGTRLTETGERLSDFSLTGSSPAVRSAVQQALDAHLAAGKVLDATAGLPGLAGVLVLLDLADDALDRASSRRRPGPPPRHCFFDPLHGTRTSRVSWRGLGSRRKASVWACSKCADDLRRHREPEVLPVLVDGRRVAYYDVPHEDSVWAATGYGTLRDDLVQRVLRGDPVH